MASADGRVLCGSCGLAYAWKAELAGKKVRCKCQAVMIIPATAPAAGAAVKSQIVAPAAPAPAAAKPAAAPATTAKPAAAAPAAPAASGVRRPVTAAPAPAAAKTSDDLGLDLKDDELQLKLDDEPAAKPKPATPATPKAPAPAAAKAAAPVSPAVTNTGGTRIMAKTDAGSYDLDIPEDGIQLAPSKDEPKPAVAAAKPAAPATPAKAAATPTKPAAPAKPVAPVAAAAMKPVAAPAAAGSSCPSCSKPVGASAVICISCGFNLKEGKKLTTESGEIAAPAAMNNKYRKGIEAQPLGFFGRIQAGWHLTKVSYQIIWQHKILVLFPAFSAVTAFIVFLSFVTPLAIFFGIFGDSDSAHPGHHAFTDSPLFYVFAFAFYFCTYFVIVFFNTALTACAMKVTVGEKPTVGYGLAVAIKRIPQIAAWALVSAVVGTLLAIIENSNKRIGGIIRAILGSAWTILTFFVVPILCVEGVGPFKAIKRSIETIQGTWGKGGLTANAAIGLVNFAILIPFVVLAGVGVVAGVMMNFFPLILISIGLLIVVGMVMSACTSAARSVSCALLYNYASGRALPSDIDEDMLAAAFAPKG